MTILTAIEKSIEHWERMVEGCKWIIESGIKKHQNLSINDWLYYLFGENTRGVFCELCKLTKINCESEKKTGSKLCILELCYGCKKRCKGCPLHEHGMNCSNPKSPWNKVAQAYHMKQFIILAEEHMIPALRDVLEMEKIDGQ